MNLFSVVILSVVLLLCLTQANGHFAMKEKGDDQFKPHIAIVNRIDSLYKLIGDGISTVWELVMNMSNMFLHVVTQMFRPTGGFLHPTLIPSNITNENNLSNRIRRKSQNATAIITDLPNYMVHNNVSSSTTHLSLLANQTSKTVEKNDNNIMSLATPSAVVGNIVEYSTNLTTNLINSPSPDMAIFNSPAEKEEKRRENNMAVDVWVMRSLLLFVFFILAAAYYYRSNIGSQAAVRSICTNNSFTESVV